MRNGCIKNEMKRGSPIPAYDDRDPHYLLRRKMYGGCVCRSWPLQRSRCIKGRGGTMHKGAGRDCSVTVAFVPVRTGVVVKSVMSPCLWTFRISRGGAVNAGTSW